MDSAGSNKNYLMPFLWMRGENEDILRNEMIKISDCGIGAVCLEARPHPDYAGKGWFHDLDIVIEEAKKRGMKVWILDDAHFPTGQANGKMKEHPSLCRRFLYTRFVDATGPIPCANVDVDLLLTRQVTWVDLGREAEEPLLKEARLLSVCVAQMDSGDTIKGDLYDITDLVKDGKLTWNVPAGTWRIYVTSVTTEGPKSNYINYIESSSVRLLIDEVYEKHYERYASEFGKTILGFFSDEPGFYNTDSFGRDNHIGMDMHLPWGREMEECFAQKVGQDWKKKLPLLWNKHTNGNEKLIRYTYMDQVSYLYEKNFSIQIGSWCRDHGVSYIGHVVEDWEGHMRLGAGAGHYFRAMAGQDMAGIDNIGNQIVPGNECVNRHAGPLITEGSFYHYEIAKLGASEAAIDPKKKGRLLCENFGAYGWHLGVRDMRWLVDFLVCQGVNHFVPHAFSMAEYPDSDCPPHFYARGNNPQFPFFADLMRYTNRLCDLFQGGKNVPQVGVLYEADADWAGRAMTGDIPAKELLTHQIDFIYIPSDVFKEQDAYALTVDGGILAVNGRPLQALVFPEAEFIPASAVSFLRSNPEVRAVFIGSRPERICGMGEGGRIPDLKKYPVVLLDDLSSYLKGIGVGDSVEVTISDRNLRMYHYRKDDRDIFFFMNTSLSDTVWTTVCLPDARSYGLYDAWKDVWYSLPVRGRQHSGRN